MLSKTDFLLFLESPMHLWAQTHNQIESKILTPYEQHLAQQGQRVEALAREYIEAILIPKYEAAQLLWQQSYNDGQFTIRADALIWDKIADVYDLYEIKSSTSVKKNHEFDVTFQVLLLETILDLRHISILHIDKTYQHKEGFDPVNFFSIEEVSEKVAKRRRDVALLRNEAFAVTQLTTPDRTFACTKPDTCPCLQLCHPDLPKNPIYDIPYIGRKAKQLREIGITAMQSVPASFNLNEKQQKHIRAAKTGKPLIEEDAIQESLSTLEYPLYFLDYETFNPAIPLFPDYHPYEHIVFQYSLHVINQLGAEEDHFECLVTDKKDPAPMIVPHLLNNIGPIGSVIVWNQSFEEQRNVDLAAHCPSYSTQLEGINHRLYDLMRIFKDGLFVHPDFHGSASLKAVLPVLCPELSYTNLAISNGEEAMMRWYWLQTAEISQEELEQTKSAMKEYCALDTFAMIAIMDKLKKNLRRSYGS